jgi:NTP pyrophosphatase (non-canonical NTP hydrolase)
MTITELQAKVLTFRDARDRKQFHNPKDLAQAVAIEAGELMENFLWKSQSDSYAIAKETENVREEFADIMNFLLFFAHEAEIDIEEAVLSKLEKAKMKYPVEKAKWSSDKYTKYMNDKKAWDEGEI